MILEKVVRIRVLYGIIIASMYTVLVWILPGISFGPLQVRVADLLNPLPYIMGFESVIGLTIGTFFANLVSQYGLPDMVIGTICTFIYSLFNYVLGRVFSYKKILLPVIAVVDTIIVGIFIGIILLSIILGVGEPLPIFLSILPGELIVNIIGALIIIPRVRKYIHR